MNWRSRLLGAGLGWIFLGGPIGAVLGFLIAGILERGKRAERHSWDMGPGLGESGAESLQMVFFTAMFSLLAKVAKSDGRISEEEGRHFLMLLDQMGLDSGMRRIAVATFNEAKDSPYSSREFAQQLAAICRIHRGGAVLLRQFFYQLMSMAAIDGVFSSQKDQLLRQIAGIFGLSASEVEQAYSQFNLQDRDSCYQVLGVPPTVSDREVRDVYRKLVKENHPDRLVQQGLPREMKAQAEKRFREIQTAWEQIKRERGLP